MDRVFLSSRKYPTIDELDENMVKIGLDTKIGRGQALAAKVDDDLILFDAEVGKYFATSGIGAEVWELIEPPRSLREICAVLMTRYEVTEDTCHADILAFVSELVSSRVAEIL